MIQIKIVRNGAEILAKRIRKLQKELPAALKNLSLDLANEATEKLFDAIVYQDYSSIALRLRAISPEWVARKRRNSWYEEPLTATLEYANSIHVEADGKGFYKVTVPYSIHPGSLITFQELAKYLEFGTKKMGALPHWEPARRWYKKEFTRRSKELLRDAVQRR